MRSSRLCGAIYNNVVETIGRTPVVRLNRLAPSGVEVYAKLEYFNPLSSVKDRLAWGVVDDAMKKGELKEGDTVVEATSGNTGVSLAMVCASRGLKCVIVMAETFSVERRLVMRALGAKVVITPAAAKSTGMVKKAQELSEKHGWWLARQFENLANRDIHASTTGPEILGDFAGRRLDYYVTGFGSGGTFAGAGRTIKAARPDVKIILSEPSKAPMVASGKEQPREKDGSPAENHAAWTPHMIQGWSPSFIPFVLDDGLQHKLYERLEQVPDEEAIDTALQLARKEGIFTGISGGGTVATALKVAREAPKGSVVLAMVPDTGERYLSSPLFAGISPDMNEEETRISQSTPIAQMEEQ